MWIDYHRRDGDESTRSNVRNARSDVELAPADTSSSVGSDETVAAVAEVMWIAEKGAVLVRVLPGSVDDKPLAVKVL